MREVEIKIKVENLEELEKKLIAKGLTISKEVFQHDVVYSRNNESVASKSKEGHTVIRIRKQDRVSTLTLKYQKSGELDCLEYESVVENPDQVHEMLRILGWNPEIEVKKLRKKGKLGEYEICLDKVEGLGTFVELEKLAADDIDPEPVREELFNVLESFGLSRENNMIHGYDTQLLMLKRG